MRTKNSSSSANAGAGDSITKTDKEARKKEVKKASAKIRTPLGCIAERPGSSTRQPVQEEGWSENTRSVKAGRSYSSVGAVIANPVWGGVKRHDKNCERRMEGDFNQTVNGDRCIPDLQAK